MSPLWIAAAAVVGLIILIGPCKVHASVALLLACFLVGLATGTPLEDVLGAVTAGIGGVLGAVALIIGLGAMLGRLLQDSGGAGVVAESFLRRFGERRTPWGMLVVGLVVGAGVWFAVGLVLLVPVAATLARRSGQPLCQVGIPMLAGLSVMHGLVPPHPGPMVAIGLLEADTGRTLLWALVVAIPLAIVAGPVFARSVAASENESEGLITAPQATPSAPLPRLFATLTILLLPVLLLLLGTLAGAFLTTQPNAPRWELFRPFIAFAASPNVAMLIAVLAAYIGLGRACGRGKEALAQSIDASLAPVASILLVVGAGGAFSRTLQVCGVGTAVAEIAGNASLSPLVLGWSVAALIRIAVGSATVAISTAAGIVGPIAATDPACSRELLVIAMGAGSLILSHVNDGGFWLVKEAFGWTMGQTFMRWTVLETLLAVGALPLLLALNAVF